MDSMDNGNRRGRRRTGRPPRTFDDTVPSPCVAICTLDEDDVCIGCFRHADEIREWMILEAAEKLAVLERVRARRRARGLPPC